MRVPHYWKPGKSLNLPQHLVVVDTETLPEPCTEPFRGEVHKLRLGRAVSYRLERGKRTRRNDLAFRTKEQFWNWLQGRLTRGNTTWIIAHNAPFDLGILGAWERWHNSDWLWSRIVVDGGIFYIKGTFHGRPVVFIDSLNYYRCSLAEVGKSVGLPKMPMPRFEEADDIWDAYCLNDVEITALAMDQLIAFWREHNLGPWGPTISSLAFSAFRSRFMDHKVLVHTDQRALKLERAAYYGGRIDTPFIGTVPDTPIWECDFQSLYPFCCISDLPCRLSFVMDHPCVSALEFALKKELGTAEVTLRTRGNTYPHRTSERVLYAEGTFRTTLPDPELRRALEAGEVLEVHEASLYQHAPLFERYVNYFYELKAKYEREESPGFRTISKYLMNTLYGKTGQRSERWLPWSRKALTELALSHGMKADALHHHLSYRWQMPVTHWYWGPEDVPVPVAMRMLWGCYELCVGHGESRDSVPAIAGTVTSRGRIKLAQAQQAAGNRHWFYSDTDSVWVDGVGLANLKAAGLVEPGTLGKLAVKEPTAKLHVWGPKDYETGDVVRRKGVRAKAKEVSPGVFEQLHFPGTTEQLKALHFEGVVVRHVLKRLRRTVEGCLVGPDGWTRPHFFQNESA